MTTFQRESLNSETVSTHKTFRVVRMKTLTISITCLPTISTNIFQSHSMGFRLRKTTKRSWIIWLKAWWLSLSLKRCENRFTKKAIHERHSFLTHNLHAILSMCWWTSITDGCDSTFKITDVLSDDWSSITKGFLWDSITLQRISLCEAIQSTLVGLGLSVRWLSRCRSTLRDNCDLDWSSSHESHSLCMWWNRYTKLIQCCRWFHITTSCLGTTRNIHKIDSRPWASLV